MIAGFSGSLRNEQGATKPLRTVAVGMIELEERNHAQAFATDGNSIDIAPALRMAVSIEWDRSNATQMNRFLVDVPRVKSGISGQMDGSGSERAASLPRTNRVRRERSGEKFEC